MLVFAQEAYLVLMCLVMVVLAFGRIETQGPAAGYLTLSLFSVVGSLFVTGIILIIFRQLKPGLIAMAFACGTVALAVLLAPLFAAAMRH